MLTPYSPPHFMEALAKERRVDPRILAAYGSSIPARRTLRHNLGEALVRLGRWIEGAQSGTFARSA
jgi:hypothetical protein